MNISEETIDSFLRGDLAGSELEQFNQALGSDPKLQQEVSLQRDIVDSIKQYRHSQLKNRLNSIEVAPVSTGNYFSAYIKLAASIGAVALLIGSYAILTNKKTDTASVTSTEQISAAQETESNVSSATNAVVSTKTQTESESANKKSPVATSSLNVSNGVIADRTDSKTAKKPELAQVNENVNQETVLSEEMANDEEFIASGSENMTIPGANHETHSTTSTSVKVNIVKEKNILAYRFFNNELYLHGNFSNSPYELFELNNKPSKQLFLYFENNYYELVQGKTKVTTLVAITDKATLLQLAQLREH